MISLQQYEKIFELSKDLIVISDNQGLVVKVNFQFLEFFRLKEVDVIGKPFLVTLAGLIHGQPIIESFENNQHENGQEFKTIIKTDAEFYQCFLWKSFRDPSSKTLFTVGTDITESYRVNIQNKQFRDLVFDTAIVATTDRNGKITSVNSNFCQITGYNQDELIGKDHRILNSGFHGKEFFKNMWASIVDGNIWRGIIKNCRKDGSYYFVHSFIGPLRNIASNIDGFIAVRFDITQAIKDSMDLNEAQTIGKIGSWHYDVLNHSIIWSEQLFEIFGLAVAERPPTLEEQALMLEEEYRERFGAAICESIKSKESLQIRVKLKANSKGSEKWLVFRGEVESGKSDRVESLHGTCQDITEIVKAQEAVAFEKQIANQTAKLASLGEMSAGVAHEINNPLAVISASMSLLKRYKDSPAEYENAIGNIKKSINRISKIISGLKKFSRNEEKRIFKPHSIQDLVKESEVIVDSKLKKNFVNLVVDIKKDYTLNCDDVGVEQVLVNLISNSIDAVKGFENRWVKVECLEQDGYFVIRVLDSGKGIPENVKAKLFLPFFTTKPSGEGTGLGLSIIKGILEEHNATIEIVEGLENTCFEIKFPNAKNGAQVA